MRDVAAKLIEVMEVALQKKKAGAPGNFQGVINQAHAILETAVRASAGTDPVLLAAIKRGTDIRLEAIRVTGQTKTRTGETTPSRQVNVAAAFDFQKKRKTGSPVVAGVPSGPEPENKTQDPVLSFEPRVIAPEVTVETLDPDLLADLASLSNPKLVDRFGGVQGVEVFARELFNYEREEGLSDTKFLNQVRSRLKALKADQDA